MKAGSVVAGGSDDEDAALCRHVGGDGRDRDVAIQLGRRVAESVVEDEISEGGRRDVDAERIRPLEGRDVIVFLDPCFGADIFRLGEQETGPPRYPVQPSRDVAGE